VTDSSIFPISLRIPLYKLFYIDDIEEFEGLSDPELIQLNSAYALDEIEEIRNALKWGTNNPNYDFKSILPGIKFNNQSIYKYICIISEQLNKNI
jgi:hypothetical protein